MDAAEVSKLTSLEDRHWWYRERRWLLRRELARLGPAAGNGSGRRVGLDLGAAGGGNTRVLREAGWAELAVEYGEQGAEVCRQRGLRAVRGDGTALPLADRTVDLVVAYDVLEHIDDHKAAVAEIARVLRPRGDLLVAVPCDMRLWSGHDVAVGHVRRYDRGELVDLIGSGGFDVLEVRSWNVLLRPVVRLRRGGGESGESDLSELSWIINAGLSSVIAAERYLPVDRWPGVSLMVRARRLDG